MQNCRNLECTIVHVLGPEGGGTVCGARAALMSYLRDGGVPRLQSEFGSEGGGVVGGDVFRFRGYSPVGGVAYSLGVGVRGVEDHLCHLHN